MRRKEPAHPGGRPRARKVKPPGERAAFHESGRETSRASPGQLEALRLLTRRELLALARREDLKGRSRLKREELVQALSRLWKIRGAAKVAPSPPDPPDWGNAPLPEAYGSNRLVLMPIDPYWVHAYWEMGSQSWPEARGRPGEENRQARCVLRVYDVTFIDFDGTNAHSSFDIEITPQTRNWYINLWSPRKSLCAELGLIQRDGVFSPLVRSNVIQTPPAWASPNTEERWLRVEWGQAGPIPDRDRVAFEAIESIPQPGPRQPALPPSRPTLGQSSPIDSQPGENPPRPPGPQMLEGLPRPEDSIRAEEYRRFLEETRRRTVLRRDEPAPPALTPLPVEDAASVFDIGLSSIEMGKKP